MLSLFGALNMAGQSLSVETQETVVTGQNLANVNNPAYARQQLNVTAATPLPTSVGEEGTGVQSVSITEVRDALLDTQIQQQGSVSGSLTAQQTALTNVEAYLNEQLSSSTGTSTSASSSGGLTQDLSTFFNSLQTLSTDPSNISDRQAVISAGQQLAQQFNEVSSGIQTVTQNINSSIQSDVSTSNEDLAQIAGLNQQIINAQSSGGTANDLIDQREQVIEDLSGRTNVTTAAQPDGSTTISIGGVTMVSGGGVADQLQTYTGSNGQLYVQAQDAGTPLTLTGGSIEGNITARDTTMATLQGSLDALAGQVTTQVNNIYQNGYDLNGGSGQQFFTGSGTAATIGVNSTLVSDPSTFQAAGTANAAGDNSTVLALAQLANTSLSSLGNQTISQNYAAAVGTFGTSLQSVNSQVSDNAGISTMLTNQRASNSGVDTDTEMTNLMQYQKAYEASAELITTINQMLETVVSMKTV